jgi:DNA-binding NarL/FixJ family response regulator
MCRTVLWWTGVGIEQGAFDNLAYPRGMETSKSDGAAPRVIALMNASDDTIVMITRMLEPNVQRLVSCHFADIKKGVIDFAAYLQEHDPDVVVFDISPPYDENWNCYKTLRDNTAMAARGVVLTTTNVARLNDVLGIDCHAIEIVGQPADLKLISDAIIHASHSAQIAREFGGDHGLQPMRRKTTDSGGAQKRVSHHGAKKP